MIFLVVTNDGAWGGDMCEVARKLGFKRAILSDHRKSLSVFGDLSPTHILVEDRTPSNSLKYITSSSSSDQVIKCCGLINKNEPNFVQSPINEDTFKQAFGL